MADVFISYSRGDGDFVRRLHTALAEAGRDAWVDWEDIPLTARFLAEIYEAIEAADTFIFVISPDALASDYCRLEIAHAAALNKRLVPVVRRDAPAEQVPAALAELNWIFLREGDDFAATFQALLAALDTDLPYVKAHTRLLTRAMEWERRDHNPSLLLRGQDLRGAEELLAGAGPEQTPAPTSQQRQYALASRRAEQRSQRTWRGALSVGLATALVLAGFAWAQRIQASAARDRAQAQARIAQSRELALAAEGQLGPDPERGVLLAMAAARLSPTAEATAVLRRALVASHVRMTLHTGADTVTRAAFSQDGRRLLTTGTDGAIRLWDAATGEQLRELTGHIGTVRSAVFSADGSMIVSGGDDGTVRAWDLSGSGHRILGDQLGVIHGVAISPDGRLVAAGLESRRALIWDLRSDLATPLALRGRADEDYTVASVAFSPNSRQLVTAGEYRLARIWDARSGAEVNQLKLDTDLGLSLTSAAFSPSGALVVIAGDLGVAYLWEPATRKARELRGHSDALTDAAFSPDGALIVTASRDRTARIWRVDTGETIAELAGHGSAVTSAQFSPDGLRVLTASEDGTARAWAAVPAAALPELKGAAVAEAYWPAIPAVSPDGRTYAVGDQGSRGSNDVLIRERRGGAVVRRLSGLTRPPHLLAFSADGTRLVGTESSQAARVWDVASGVTIAVLNGDTGVIASVDIRADGRRVVTGGQDDGMIRLWDAESGAQLRQWRGHTDAVMALRFSPDGALVASASRDKTLRLWQATTGAPVGEPHRHEDVVTAAAFSPNGALIASASADGSARIWETRGGAAVAELRERRDQIGSVAFSPDSSFVVTVGRAWTGGLPSVRVWTVSGGARVAEIQIAGTPRTATFSADGRQIVVGDRDITAHVYTCEECVDLAALLALASTRVTRALTCSERVRFLHEAITCEPVSPGASQAGP